MGPLRNVGVTTACPVCGLPFTPVGRQQGPHCDEPILLADLLVAMEGGEAVLR
jgi:hypothetical protein